MCLASTPKPQAVEEKVISIATVCPRQKTPQKLLPTAPRNPTESRERPDNAPRDFCVWPPGLLGTAAPKLLWFTWGTACTGLQRSRNYQQIIANSK